jgi:ribonuclease HI
MTLLTTREEKGVDLEVNTRSLPGPSSIPENFPLFQYQTSPIQDQQSVSEESSQEFSESLLESLEESPGSLNLSSSTETEEIPNYKLPVSLPSISSLELPVGARLKHFVAQWEEMGASPFILKVLGKGYKIPFKEKPKLTYDPCMESISKNPVRDQLIEDQFQELVEKKVLEVVPGPYYGPSYFSIIFMVPKPNGKWRPVIDLKMLNQSVECPHFKMDDAQRVWETLLPDHYAFSIDLKDAYLHVPIHKHSRKYLRVYRKGIVYQFRALPFGLCTAPLIFTKIVAEVKEMVQSQGINMCSFLDDWLHLVRTYSLGKVQARYMVELCKHLGWIVNQEKSELTPVQEFKFIGVWWNLRLARVFPTEENVLKVMNLISLFLNSHSQRAQMWQSLIGRLTAQQRFVYLARLHVRPIQWNMMFNWIQGVDSQDQEIQVTPETRSSLLWWRKQLQQPQGVPLIEPEFDLHIFTDASTHGWGGVAPNCTFQDAWTQEETSLHINVLEMRAVTNTLERMESPQGSRILVASDNTTVVAHINKQGGTHSWQLMVETFNLFQLLQERDWYLKARHIPGKFNVIADQLSRSHQVVSTEWSLHPKVVEEIFTRWFRPEVDLFATRYNRKCKKFVSPVPDEEAMAVDGLSQDLEGLQAYAYPPHQILMKLLQKFQMTRNCRLIVIAPFWPKQVWLPVLERLSVVEPIQLPHWQKLLKQPMQGRFHLCPESLDLHAFWLERGTL